MKTQKGLTNKQRQTILGVIILGIFVLCYFDSVCRVEPRTIANTRQIPLLSIENATHYYWEYEPGRFSSNLGATIEVELIPVNNLISVYAETGYWIRIHHLQEITPGHYIELEVEIMVIR